MATPTTNLGLFRPTVGGSENTWGNGAAEGGGGWNENAEILDEAVLDKRVGGTVTGDLVLNDESPTLGLFDSTSTGLGDHSGGLQFTSANGTHVVLQTNTSAGNTLLRNLMSGSLSLDAAGGGSVNIQVSGAPILQAQSSLITMSQNADIEKNDPTLTLNDESGVLGADVDAVIRFEANGAAQGSVGFSGTNAGSMVMANEDGSLFLTVEAGDNISSSVGGSTRFRVSESAVESFVDTLNGTPDFTIDNKFGERIRLSNTDNDLEFFALGIEQLNISNGVINAPNGAGYKTTKDGGLTNVCYAVSGVTNTGMYGAASGDVLNFAANGVRGIQIDGTGGGETRVTAPLYVAGDAVFNAGVNATNVATSTAAINARLNTNGDLVKVTSSAQFKKNIREVDLDYMDLSPVMFEANELTAEPGLTGYGFIAEEVAAVSPTAAEYNPDGSVQNYNRDAVLAALAKGLQELTRKVEGLH